MSKRYMDWADWADDHMMVCEDLQPNCGGNCEHAEVDNQGVCENCATEVEGWEPDDAQLLHQFGTKEPAV